MASGISVQYRDEKRQQYLFIEISTIFLVDYERHICLRREWESAKV